MTIPYFLYRILSFTHRQITRTSPKKYWNRVVINENGEKMVKVLESLRLKIGIIKKQYDASFYVRESVAKKLTAVSNNLPSNLVLVLIEGYRPLEFQKQGWDNKWNKLKAENPNWSDQEIDRMTTLVCARPNPLANHRCGGAVDVTLAYENGELVDMGSLHPSVAQGIEVQRKFPMFAEGLTSEQRKNRAILRKAMESAGFVWYPGEWWHYCYGDRMWAVYTNRTECMYGPVEMNS